MVYNLYFLGIDVGKSKDDFLQHIYELIHIGLTPGETYGTMFQKIRDYFKDDPSKLLAANSFVNLNIESNGDVKSFLNTVIIDPNEIRTMYVIFNLIPIGK